MAVAYEAKGGLSDPKATATAAVLKGLLNETREVLPWVRKDADGPLTSLTPVIQVGVLSPAQQHVVQPASTMFEYSCVANCQSTVFNLGCVLLEMVKCADMLLS